MTLEELRARLAPVASFARRTWQSETFRGWLLLAVILRLLLYVKLPFTEHSWSPLPDGGTYLDIARHVRDGDGFVTDICLAHQGCPTFPSPTAIYPLWPFVLGHLARHYPLIPMGRWLPTGLYFVSLVAAYLWGRALVPRSLFPRALLGFNAGHVLVFLIALDHEYFRYTSCPYTEGLTWTIIFLALYRFTRLFPRPSALAGVELGAWLALAFLARKQEFILTLAAAPVLLGAIAFVRERRAAYSVMSACAAVAFAIVVWPHYRYLKETTPHFTLGAMLRWDEVQYTKAISPLRTVRPVAGLWRWILDRWSGVSIAFGTETMSYSKQYYAAQWAVLFAVPLLFIKAYRRRTRDDVRAAVAWLRRPEGVSWAYVVVLALAGLLSIHTLHMFKDASGEWVFAARQAMTCVFAIFLALVLLLTEAPSIWVALGTLALCGSIYGGVTDIRAQLVAIEKEQDPPTPAIADWLNKERAEHGRIVVVYRQPQMIAQYTTGVGYHWYDPNLGYKDLTAMFTQLGADYVVASSSAAPPFARDPHFSKDFVAVTHFGRDTVYAPSPEFLEAHAVPQKE
jgi:hypothetical protein